MGHAFRARRRWHGGRPAFLKRADAIVSPPSPADEASRLGIHGMGLFPAPLAVIAAPAGPQTASAVQPVSPPDSVKPTGAWGLASLDRTTITLYAINTYRYRSIANKVQWEMWAGGPYPPRTIVEVYRLNDDDILEVEERFTYRRRNNDAAGGGAQILDRHSA